MVKIKLYRFGSKDEQVFEYIMNIENWPVVPRIGETIKLEDARLLTIYAIKHQFSNTDPCVLIYAHDYGSDLI